MPRVLFADTHTDQWGREPWRRFWINPDFPLRSDAMIEIENGPRLEYWVRHTDGSGWEKVEDGVYNRAVINENVASGYYHEVNIP